MGKNALKENTTGHSNVAVGRLALQSNTTGIRNVAVGEGALGSNLAGHTNTGIGHRALAAFQGSAGECTAVGTFSQYSNTSGPDNNSFGYDSLAQLTTGSYNCAFGNISGDAITTGTYNVAIGQSAGGLITTGSYNVCVGPNAGAVTTGSNQLYIARSNANQGNNPVWIYGDGSGNVVQGNNATAWSQASDERIKKNITDSSDGLAKIDALQVRNFEYRTDAEITVEGLTGIDKAGVQVGAIAQEVEVVLPTAVHIGNGTQKQLKTDPIFWAMVKAIQELSDKVTALENA